MVGPWVFTIRYFKLLGRLEIFHKKMRGRNWCSPGFCHFLYSPLPNFVYILGRDLGYRPISLIISCTSPPPGNSNPTFS